MNADGTLDLIDGALRDYETSSDAMRWTPDEDARDDRWSQIQGMTPSLVIYDEVPWFEAGLDPTGQTDCTAAIQAAVDALDAYASIPTAAWIAAVIFSGGIRVEFPPSHIAQAILWPLQHIRCHDCHPDANPRSLAINGAAYRRRQKARRRR